MIDCGATRTRVADDQGQVLADFESVVAVNLRSGSLVAVGDTARKMSVAAAGRVELRTPFQRGMATAVDYFAEYVELVFKQIGLRVGGRVRLGLSVPSSLSSLEREVIGAEVGRLGTAESLLIPSVLAGAVGAGVDITQPEGSMIFQGGASSCEVAVFSFGEMISYRSRPVGGRDLVERVMRYFSESCGLVISSETASEIVVSLVDLSPERRNRRADVWGRDSRSGEVRQVRVEEDAFFHLALPPVDAMVDLVPEVLSVCQAELVADIAERGVTLIGGLALLAGLSARLASSAQVKVMVPADPDLVVLRGLTEILRHAGHATYDGILEQQGRGWGLSDASLRP